MSKRQPSHIPTSKSKNPTTSRAAVAKGRGRLAIDVAKRVQHNDQQVAYHEDQKTAGNTTGPQHQDARPRRLVTQHLINAKTGEQSTPMTRAKQRSRLFHQEQKKHSKGPRLLQCGHKTQQTSKKPERGRVQGRTRTRSNKTGNKTYRTRPIANKYWIKEREQ